MVVDEITDAVNNNENEESQGSSADEDINPDEWCDQVDDVDYFLFDFAQQGIKVFGDENSTPMDIFEQIWNEDIMTLLVKSTNTYGKKITQQSRPKTRNSRTAMFKNVTDTEMKKFIGLCLLQGQIKAHSIRKLFSLDPLNYHPIFPYTMSGRRFEQILRCFSVHANNPITGNADKLQKVRELINMCNRNFQAAYSPSKELSLDESLLLFRGRLSFRTYMKNKKTKYGIKFYELCSPEGYILNVEIYKGQGQKPIEEDLSKIDALVIRLMQPYLNKGHHLFIDNYYNSVTLANRLLQNQTHVTGTLRSNRRGNPQLVVRKKLNRGEHIWQRKKKYMCQNGRTKETLLLSLQLIIQHW